MAQQIINVGNVANDGQGDPLRTAFIKTNDNFTELYNIGGLTGIQNGNSNITIAANSTINMAVTGVPDVVVVYDTGMTVTGLIQGDEISSVGNVYSDYFFGNGALLSGLSSQNANALTGTTLAPSVIYSSLTTVGALSSLSVSGNITGSNSANIVVGLRAGNIVTPGTLTVGQGATFGNGITAGGTFSTSGNIVGNNIIGNMTFASLSTSGNVTGANLVTSGIVTAAGNLSGANIFASGFITAAGNITGNYIIGNGSQLTGLPASYSNANVAAYLPTYTGALTGSTLSLTGNILSGVATTGEIKTTANITGDYYIGNGSQLTGIVASEVGTLTSLSVTGNAIIDGNLTSATLTTGAIKGSTLSLSGLVQSPLNSASDISTSGNIYSGNGLIGALSVVSNINSGGTISATGNINGATFNGAAVNVSSYVHVNGTGNAIWTAGNVSATNLNSATGIYGTEISATSTVTGGNIVTGGLITATGNIDGGNLLTSGEVSATGNVTGGNVITTGLVSSTTVNATGDITGGNIKTGGLISAVGNIVTDGFFIGTFQGNITGNLVVPGLNGQVLYNNAGNAGASAGLTFNVGSNTLSTGNMYADYFYGNGAGLTGIQATVVGVLSSLSVTGNAVVGNLSTAGVVSAGGNILTNGLISAAGNIISGGNISAAGNIDTTGNISITGNVNAGNVNLTSNFSVAGNVTSNFYFGNSIEIEDHIWSGGTGNVFWTPGNITGGNISSYGNIDTSENINAGNLYVDNDISLLGNVFSFGFYGNTLEVEDHVFVGGTGNAIWTSGNITGNYIFGNGTFLTGVSGGSSYSNANVAAYLPTYTGNISAGNISATGNITAANFVGGGAGTPTLSSATNLDLSAAAAVRVIGGGTLRLPNLTAAQISGLVASNGDLVYNTTVNKIQGYENGAWGNLI